MSEAHDPSLRPLAYEERLEHGHSTIAERYRQPDGHAGIEIATTPTLSKKKCVVRQRLSDVAGGFWSHMPRNQPGPSLAAASRGTTTSLIGVGMP